MPDAPETRQERRTRIVHQLPLLLGLVLLWMLLWGTVSWLSLATGVVVAVFVTQAFYLPAIELGGRLDVLRLVVFLALFFAELLTASFTVAAQAFRPGRRWRNAIIAVQLASRADLITTLTSIAISLIPGSIVLEVDRPRSIIYIHVLNVRDEAGVERMREHVMLTERRIVRALGSRADLERVER